MKRLFSFFTAALLVLLLPVASFGAINTKSKVYDPQKYFSSAELSELRTLAQGKSAEYEMDILFLITDEEIEQDIMDYADDFYDYNGFAADGILLVIHMGLREMWISTAGEAIHLFSDSLIDCILYDSELEDALIGGEYAQTARRYYELAEQVITGELEDGGAWYPDDPNDYDGSYTPDYWQPNNDRYVRQQFTLAQRLLVCAVISLAVALVVVLLMRSRNKLGHQATAAQNYLASNSFRLTQMRNEYITTTVTRHRIQTQTDSNHHGSSSSGGSSTHTSSSGTSHGGGGRSF